MLLPKSFSSKDDPNISLVTDEDASVGNAIAARTTPVRSFELSEALQSEMAALPVWRTRWYKGSSSFKSSLSMSIPSGSN